MSENWNRFIDEILSNIDNGDTRRVAPIDNNDIKSIVQLDAMEALILWNTYFSETVKYALLFEHTYGKPVMTTIFDESETDPDSLSDTYKGILRLLHLDETPILIYWNSHVAIKTTWGMFIKYWNNFFYYPEDAIIYVNQDQVYFYNEMMLKKINKSKLKNVSGESIFDCLQKLENNKTKKSKALDCLLEEIPSDLHDDLYFLFHIISEGFKAIGNDDHLKEYMEYCRSLFWSNTTELVSVCKSYSEKSLQYIKKDLDEKGKIFDKPSVEKYYEMLKKIVDENLRK